MTGIEWTDATWNPATGCSKVSAGCANCYAETMALRLQKMGKPKYAGGFKYAEHWDALALPHKWRKPRRIFVNSMSDLFHEDATLDFIYEVFDTMMAADRHTYQVLTKRPEKMRDIASRYCAENGLMELPSHIWMGTSVENGDATPRISALRWVPAAVRFVSFEPLLGPIPDVYLTDIHWAIIGGESGPDARPMKEEWVRGLIAECRRQDVAVFFKQWGGPRPGGAALLDGKEIREYPEVPA